MKLEMMPLSSEVVKILTEDWSEPVELKVENGELIIRGIMPPEAPQSQ